MTKDELIKCIISIIDTHPSNNIPTSSYLNYEDLAEDIVDFLIQDNIYKEQKDDQTRHA